MPNPAEAAVWSVGPTFPGTSLAGGTAGVVGSKAYFIGGDSGGGGRVWSYDFETDTWNLDTTLPASYPHGSSLAIYNETTGNLEFMMDGKVYLYNVSASTMSYRQSNLTGVNYLPNIVRRSGDSVFYGFGAHSANRWAGRFSMTDTSALQLGIMPSDMNYYGIPQGACLTNTDYIYLVGGANHSGNYSFDFAQNKVYRYSISGDDYTPLPDLTYPYGLGTYCQFRNLLYMVGADNDPAYAKTLTIFDMSNEAVYQAEVSRPAVMGRGLSVAYNGVWYTWYSTNSYTLPLGFARPYTWGTLIG